ncbi:MAG: hypothetical protein M3Q29_19310, partial [Chloroflexota bacterium]|nr:hypothetical protein [Chloroflexota bacterium]
LVELLIDRVIVTDGDVEIRYVLPTSPGSEHVRFCHLRTDYFYAAHHPVVAGNTLYLSWYSDGVRVLDLSHPASLQEIAWFVPPDTRDPFSISPNRALVWGVVVDRGLVMVSDINSGLYVLRARLE